MKTKYRGVYKDSNGKFFYQVYLGMNENGKKLQIKSRKDQAGNYFHSAKEANLELIRVQRDFQLNSPKYTNKISYTEFVKKKYLPAYKINVENSTYLMKSNAFKIILNRFKLFELTQISVRDAESFRLWLLEDAGYSRDYAALVYGAFRKSLNYAVKLGYLTKNESMKTEAISKSKAHVKYWTKKQFENVITNIYIDDYFENMCFVILWTYYMTGIRVSEGLALRWSDIDFSNKKMDISHSLRRKSKGDFDIIPYTKTASGIRKISLDGDTLRILSNWKKRQQAHGLNQFIFSVTDRPIYRSTVLRIIQRYAKLAGVPLIQAKGLRHSHVSYLINEFNADVLVVSKRLGHSSPEITLKYYAHLWGVNDENIAKQLTGNINIQFSSTKKIKFNGNQSMNLSAKILPK
ncbi:tyrosine-type recombinase/integrase [Companilactobacillus mishanensis]|uniref:tyrosine-type recombinase/integrase n=1 Tax=Companilactobacillus mishanensis TaxID=2486008 RepID=UPI001CDB64A9|nr:site-specific integrase [Companilactobacillus mishanensis]